MATAKKLTPVLKCPNCKKKFRGPIRARLLGAHRHFVHGYVGTAPSTVLAREKRQAEKALQPKGPVPCPECGLVFKNTGAMGNHRNKIHGISARQQREAERALRPKGPALCPECGLTFKNIHGLAMHRSKLHGIAGTAHPQRIINRRLAKGAAANGNRPSSTNDIQEIDPFTLGYAVASVRALIANLAERDGIPEVVLTSRCAAILHGSTLRQRGRPRHRV